MNEELNRQLIKRCEQLCDEDEQNNTNHHNTEINILSSLIQVFELIHYPISDIEEKYSKIAKELFYPDNIISETDAEIFFNSIVNPKEPNKALKKAAKEIFE